MTPIPSAEGTGFLAALATLVRHDEFDAQIAGEDGNLLRIKIQVHPHKALEAIGPGPQLDAQLPAAIQQYSRWVDEQEALRGAVKINTPAGRLEAPRAVAAPKRLAKPAKRARPKARAAVRPTTSFLAPMYPDATLAAVIGASPMTRTEVTKKIWAYIKRNGLQDKKNRRNINTDEKLKAVFGGKASASMFEMVKLIDRHLSKKPQPAAKASATTKRRAPAAKRAAPSNPLASLPGKPDCIADYKAMKAKFGDKLNRRKFVDNAKTGRRYEKLWGNSWPTFVKEASGDKAAPPAKPAAAKPAAAAPKKAMPPAPKKPTASKPAKDDKRPWTIKAKGKTVGATILEKKPGDKCILSAGTFVVQSIDSEKREIYAELDTAQQAAPKADPAPAAAAKKAIPYAIKSADGTTLGAIVKELAVGATWGPFERWEVTAVDHEKREYTVKDRNPAAAPPAAEPQSANPEKPA